MAICSLCDLHWCVFLGSSIRTLSLKDRATPVSDAICQGRGYTSSVSSVSSASSSVPLLFSLVVQRSAVVLLAKRYVSPLMCLLGAEAQLCSTVMENMASNSLKYILDSVKRVDCLSG